LKGELMFNLGLFKTLLIVSICIVGMFLYIILYLDRKRYRRIEQKIFEEKYIGHREKEIK